MFHLQITVRLVHLDSKNTEFKIKRASMLPISVRKSATHVTVYHHCNSTASFQLDNLALCGDVHPNPGFDPEVSLIQDRNTQTISKRKNMLVHLNARSLLQHIDELRLIFSKVFPPIIAITETWLDNSIEDSEIAIPNYSVERLDR